MHKWTLNGEHEKKSVTKEMWAIERKVWKQYKGEGDGKGSRKAKPNIKICTLIQQQYNRRICL